MSAVVQTAAAPTDGTTHHELAAGLSLCVCGVGVGWGGGGLVGACVCVCRISTFAEPTLFL